MAVLPKQNNITTIIEEERGLTGRGSQEVIDKPDSDEQYSDDEDQQSQNSDE